MNKVFTVLLWILSVFFILNTLVFLSIGSVASSVLMLIASLLVLPPAARFLANEHKIVIKTAIKTFLVFTLFIVAMASANLEEESNIDILVDDQNTETKELESTKEEKELIEEVKDDITESTKDPVAEQSNTTSPSEKLKKPPETTTNERNNDKEDKITQTEEPKPTTVSEPEKTEPKESNFQPQSAVIPPDTTLEEDKESHPNSESEPIITTSNLFKVSKQARTKYYCDTDPAWKNLKPENVLTYYSEVELRKDYPNLTLNKPC